ncbi:MAG TPA: PocR ligand-binding domain-containing protein [Nitrospirota bacterium]|jgi:PAS domain S-box-containing protein
MVSINIAIVDDERSVSVLLSRFLSREAPHLSIASFESGQDLLEFLKTNEVDCILSDYQMPVMSGLDLLAAIKEQGYDIPVIFITGQGNEDLARDVFRSGAFDYFTKDIGFAHLPRIINSIEQAIKRRAAERSRLEAEDFLNIIVNENPYSIWISDDEGTLVRINRACCDLLRIKEEEVVGKYNILRDEVIEEQGVMPLVKKVFENGEAVRFDIKYDSSRLGNISLEKKTCVMLNVTIFPIVGSNGRVTNAVIQHTDISERKRVEEALEKRLVALTRPLDTAAGIAFEELFNMEDIQRLQDEFALATGVASLITRPDGTPITAPSSFCRICKDIIRKTEKGRANCRRSDAIIGRLSTQGPVVEPCLSGGLWDAGAGISVGGQHIANWLVGQVRDATQTEEKMRAYARDIGADEDAVVEAFLEVPAMSRERFGQVAQALFTLANQLSATAYQNVQQARFISESKRAEEALRMHEKRRAELYSMISHDFKSPISIIVGYAKLIMSDKDKLDADTFEMVSAIEGSCARLYSMVEDAVASFKLEDGFISLNKIHLDIAGYINEIVVPFKVLARQKGLTLESGISTDLPKLEIDRRYMDRAVSNLLQNAINYAPAGGVITVTARRGKSESVPAVIISVKDTGPGISIEEQGRIFEKYYRSPKTSGIAGTGLGLVIARTVVEAHGGRVEVQSEEGKGSTFRIILPALNE